MCLGWSVGPRRGGERERHTEQSRGPAGHVYTDEKGRAAWLSPAQIRAGTQSITLSLFFPFFCFSFFAYKESVTASKICTFDILKYVALYKHLFFAVLRNPLPAFFASVCFWSQSSGMGGDRDVGKGGYGDWFLWGEGTLALLGDRACPHWEH